MIVKTQAKDLKELLHQREKTEKELNDILFIDVKKIQLYGINDNGDKYYIDNIKENENT